ncbi:MAG: class I SAM-dependent rRNA methyltransferase, partial [Nitrospirales bacterium]|nr:class I SAM-dependent rRNA methyltransferase [Nitrospirales bacterium]
MQRIQLKRTSRVNAGHLWIFSNELAGSPKDYEPGSLVEVYDNRGEVLGVGYVNPHSLIAVRLLTGKKEEIGPDFLRKRIHDALEYRKGFVAGQDSFRAVYSEGDFLPGLIVDKYGDCLVVQILTAGMERMKDMILTVLDETFSPSTIVLKNDSQIRTLEGLPLGKELVKGSLSALPHISEGGVMLEVDPFGGQKTGFFLDQRENRIKLAGYVNGGKALDLFCYSGGWGLQLAGAGADVLFVDDSEHAISTARNNAGHNGFEERCRFEKADCFDFLKKEAAAGSLYDVVVLDPPAFVKSKLKIKEAMKGYKEINTLAMAVVKEGGILATSSCSYHIEKGMFLDILRAAAREAKRSPRLLELRTQGRDHPVLLSVRRRWAWRLQLTFASRRSDRRRRPPRAARRLRRPRRGGHPAGPRRAGRRQGHRDGRARPGHRPSHLAVRLRRRRPDPQGAPPP